MRTITWSVGGLSIGASVAGLLYQRLASTVDTRHYPPPGQLVDVGGCRLHLYCIGQPSGRPTVVLEGGISSTCLDWCKVQPAVAKFTQVCSYDRAGFGWSDSGRGGYTSQDLVEQLHVLLTISPESRQIIAEESGHYIQLDQPELVIDAIKSLALQPGH